MHACCVQLPGRYQILADRWLIWRLSTSCLSASVTVITQPPNLCRLPPQALVATLLLLIVHIHCCGNASGISLPRPLWFAVCAPHATLCSMPLIRVFCRVLSSELVERKQNNTNNNQQKTRLEASKPSTYYPGRLQP